MKRLLKDAAGFGAAEMFRRLIGMAHVSDFWSIEDEEKRAAAESLGLDIAKKWIRKSREIEQIEDLSGLVREGRVLL